MGGPLDFIRLMRPVNCVMIGFAVIVGAVIGGGTVILTSPLMMLLSFMTGLTLTGSAMAINDYYDREIDAINEPGRPIPSGAVKPMEALAVSLVLSIFGLVASWLTSAGNSVIAFLAWMTMIAYSTIGKRTGLPGNMMVSTLISLPFIYGGILIGGSSLKSSLLFALMAFLANTGRELTKGIVDLEGDGALGIRTVAVSKGAVVAARLSAILYALAIAVSPLPLYFGLVSFWYVPFVGLTDLGLLYLSLSLIRNPSRENGRRVKNRVRLLMISGLLGFLLGNLL
ncbi:MAG: geranylgeranylglycerol-phosphate geranylgeranyltransferase [Candidatus Bathyarchaeia archaeon]